jgi:hypothetical protein
MGRHQHDIDELARMERICLELAAGAAMPEERAGLEFMAGNYRAAILDIKAGNAFADTVQTQGFFSRSEICRKLLILLGERAGARTQDPVIKSHVLYRLSYALPWPLMAFKEIAIVFGHSRSMSCCHALLASRGKPAVLRIMLAARAV